MLAPPLVRLLRPTVAAPAFWDAARFALVAAIAVCAAAFVFPFADSANDGSRLAGIESVGLRGTLVIDDSVYVRAWPPGTPNSPYRPGSPNFQAGTPDKLFADGHFYSHQTPVPLVLAGGVYRVWLWFGGPDPAAEPAHFARGLTILTAVLPFALSVWWVGRMCRRSAGLSAGRAFAVTAAFGVGTMALAYTRSVNGHVLLLAVFAGLCSLLAAVEADGRLTARRAALLGMGTGLAYCLDGALGPATVLVVGGYVLLRRWQVLAVTAAAAVPWLAAHHALQYACTGDWYSPASNPKFWAWPGCPFPVENLTGVSFKHTAAGTAVYVYELLLGRRGFFWHNLPLLFAVAAACTLAVRSRRDRPAVAVVAAWAAASTLPYFLLSNTFSGVCLSVRWFLPLVAPGFWLIALGLKRFPATFAGFCWLSACGAVLGIVMYQFGPWKSGSVPHLYTTGIVGLVGWAVFSCRARHGCPESARPNPGHTTAV